MGTAFWLTIRIGDRRIPIPLVPLLPFVLLLDILGTAVLLVFSILKRKALFLRIGLGFYLTRLVLTLILWGGRLKIRVQDEGSPVSVSGGWKP